MSRDVSFGPRTNIIGRDASTGKIIFKMLDGKGLVRLNCQSAQGFRRAR